MEATPEIVSEETPNEKNDAPSDSAQTHSRSSKFRFKSSKRRDRSPNHREHRDSRHERSHHRRHHHREHRSSKRRRTRTSRDSPPRSPGSKDKDQEQRSLSPETAFRESLFDAMADDEGAAFWESVYGQPIHAYAVPNNGPEGELERMTEEEYAAYVRARMWERSHEGIMAERERQRQEKLKAKKESEKSRQRDHERSQFDQAVEESLRRGEARRRAKSWKAAWGKYTASWEELNAAARDEPSSRSPNFHIRNNIHWPVESGKRRDISRDEIRQFIYNAPGTAESKQSDLMNTLKAERVRWHPDKMLHRYGNLGLNQDKSLIQSVTEVFQILDQLWTETKTS